MKRSDLTDSEIRQIHSLGRKKYRVRHGKYLIEGKRLVAEALSSGVEINSIILSEEFINDPGNQSFLVEADKISERRIVRNQDIRKISTLTAPPGILAVLPLTRDDRFPNLLEGNALYLDRISNPGNLGTLIRSAVWFDVTSIILSPKCADPYNPKVIQGAMGAHFHASLYRDVPSSVLPMTGHTLIGATMSGKPLAARGKIPAPWILLLGSEAAGLSPECEALLNLSMTIPRRGHGESLNVSVAGGILLSQLSNSKS